MKAGWMDHLETVLSGVGGDGVMVDRRRVRPGVNTYIVPSFDRAALQFSLPIRIERNLENTGRGAEGLDGVAAIAVEAIKAAARSPSAAALDPLAGRGTGLPDRYTAPVEPYTLIASPSAIGGGIFRAGEDNRADPEGFALTLTGALPPTAADDPGAIRDATERIDRFVEAVGVVVQGQPDRVLEAGRISSLDQKGLRRALPSLGLVAFVGDGTLPAREYTRYRCHFRVAGPRGENHVAFRCPEGLNPVEVELPVSGENANGLGLRKGEVFAIAGSNAEGKSTLLSAVLAGVDDHLPGDGRERVVTVPGPVFAEAGAGMHHAADLSLFFDRLPPSLRGTPNAASGPGSGSTSMAEEMGRAIGRKVPLLAFDEDRSAVNLLVPSCLSAPGVVPLSTLLATRRERLGHSTILFTTGALDLLTAEADRILVLEGFRAKAMDRAVFRRRLASSLRPAMDRFLEN
ncbi:putative ATPase of the ABC class [anaerobic digester metagenome]